LLYIGIVNGNEFAIADIGAKYIEVSVQESTFSLEPIAKLGWRGELLGFEG
jgi:hypothetical protein